MSLYLFKKKEHSEKSLDWAQQEIADFYRAQNLLAQQGLVFGIDRGLTDIGEPWLVFYDVGTGDVFLHIARISGKCILVCEQLGLNLKGHDIQAVLDRFEEEIMKFVSEKREQNVIRHPASKAIFTITAAILLFKSGLTSKSEAHASVADDNGLFDVSQGRKMDTLLNRALANLSRTSEGVEAPGLVAAGAAAVISNYLVSKQIEKETETAISVDDLTLALTKSADEGTVDGHSEIASEDLQTGDQEIQNADIAVSSTQAVEEHANIAVDVPKEETAQSSSSVEKEVSVTQALKSDFGTPNSVAKKPDAEASSTKEVSASDDIVEEELVEAEEESVASDELVERPANLKNEEADETDAIEVSLSFKAASDFLPLAEGPITVTTSLDSLLPDSASEEIAANQEKDAATLEDTEIELEETLEAEAEPIVRNNSEITIDNVAALRESVGLYENTAIEVDVLYDTLKNIFLSFDQFEVESADGNVLIEQANISNVAHSDLGIQQFTLKDGSFVSVVGSSEIVSEITAATA